ncbi:pyruvate dehydrogenase E2 component (dihydrolipoamide acetyltransferase) [Halalkaliarchaeum desulfuricum]|uniref:Pyruvate dehydrogenase E2 component (Dihydrolipoamide acetyltransferase) n=2 Tax=Halalkaliarchaeum desulfuricum TaxID=2055893 RepID=A0A343TN38_9EURY|nr:pyruvate dehydrogenase E2 component (dihydrolipoamide acetyltransferase) [Halalkaliarchaeum desulfuricum]
MTRETQSRSMGYLVKMPKLGMEMSEGTVVEWLFEEGDSVEADEPIAEIESEKTSAEIEAREDGVLRQILLAEGETCEPGDPIGIVAGPDEDISDLEAAVEGGEPTPEAEPTAEPTGEAEPEETTAEESGDAADSAADVKATPRARKRAEELGVDLVGIEGTGPSGAVSADDVEAAAEAATERQAEADEEPVESAAGTAGLTVSEERTFGQMRQTIANRLGESYREAVHVTEHRHADAEALLSAADVADAELEVDVSIPDILLVALSAALEEHPEFNATFEEDTHRLYEEHNVGIAVDVEQGLLTPVLRDVGSLSLDEIAKRRREITTRVLEGDYDMSDLQGGTFTVTNLGMFGVEQFDPIINPPQIAILGVNAIDEQPVRGDDGVTFRRQLPLSLSFDHRVVDGADAARFLGTLVEHLEEPWPLLPDAVSAAADVAASDEEVELPERTVTTHLREDLSGWIEAGSFEWEFDVTEKFGGSGGPTPVDYYLGALSSCLASSIGIQADIRDVELSELSVEAEATPEEGSVESLAAQVTIDGDADDETLERLVENGERTCHVAELLREDVPLELDWERP